MSATFSRLGSETYVSLASFRRDGREVRTPVWIAESDGRLYAFSAGDAGKVKRVRATRRVRLAGCDVRGRLHGDWCEGNARIVTEDGTRGRAYAALRRKYGWQMWLLDLTSRLAGRIGRRALIEIEPAG